MANLIKRLLRHRPSAIPIPSCVNHISQFQTLAPSIFTRSIDSRLRSLLPSPPKPPLENPQVKYDFIYPSFSYGLTVNPVFQKAVTDEEAEAEESGDGVEEMWMDSTKKKRKRKMNKHKYKKLMKRTRNTN